MFDRQLRHMSHLVDDLMEVARISQGKLVLRVEPVCLAACRTWDRRLQK
ncbi:hypothetical protein [Massilia rubra]|nr:hypothetical protein [Massilia rubra]